MLRLIGRRLLLMVPTLILASMLIFALAEVLPGDVGRSILGPYATQEQVAINNHELGADRPLVRALHHLGRPLRHRQLGRIARSPGAVVFSTVMKALGNSLLLAASRSSSSCRSSIPLGVFAGLRRDSLLDRTITVSTLSMTVIPEFVSGVILLYIFAVWLKWLPVTATARGLALLRAPVLPHPAGHPAHVPRARLHRAHGPRRHRPGARHAVHPHRRPQGPSPDGGSSSATCCATPWSPRSPSSAARSAGSSAASSSSRRSSSTPASASSWSTPPRRTTCPCSRPPCSWWPCIYMISNLIADIVVALLNPRIRMGG